MSQNINCNLKTNSTGQTVNLSLVNIGVPTGTILTFASSTPSVGYLECDGSLLDVADYPELYAVISNTYGEENEGTDFYLPDLRGEFIRGWDNGRGIDSGRVFGSNQTHMILDHYHNYHAYSVASSNPQTWITPTTPHSWFVYSTTYSTTNISTNTPSDNKGAETRPRNITMLYVIKY
jgi:microcystin-dependent protein